MKMFQSLVILVVLVAILLVLILGNGPHNVFNTVLIVVLLIVAGLIGFRIVSEYMKSKTWKGIGGNAP